MNENLPELNPLSEPAPIPEPLPEPIPAAETAPDEKAANPDRYKVLVVVLTVFTTVLTALIAGLQADANIRASVSNRDSQVNAILAAGELHRQGLQAAYDTTVFTDYLKDAQEATVLQLTALQQDQAGNTEASQISLQQADVAQARADMAQKFSIFFTDPRYAAQGTDALPNMQKYLDDSLAKANELVAKQNTAADEYDHWNRKGDAYTSVLAVLAVAFFLFGLAQALKSKLRLLMAVFGLLALAGAGLWTVVIMIG
jgi:hypothetical protein